MKIYNPKELSVKEKANVMGNTFPTEKRDIKNITDYLAKSFSKVDGFQYRWNSLITSNPLLFEDIDYIRCKNHVNNVITDQEKEAFKRGELREMYATFENMIVCNLQYYERIMNFCTMIFMKYVRLSEDEITYEHLEKLPYYLDMTPTQIWCCALSSPRSTEWELNYAWALNNKINFEREEGKSPLELNFNKLYKIPTFAKFIEYSAYRKSSQGFRETLFRDKTSNRILAQVCSKYTSSSAAISEKQLSTINNYIKEQESINNKLYSSLYKCLKKMFDDDETQFAIYIYTSEFFIHSSKFSIKVSKNEKGQITKEYLANSFECFIAEQGLIDSVKIQIEWAKYVLPIQYEYDKTIIKSLLTEMLNEDYRNIIGMKRMNEFGVASKVSFKGVFNNVYILEEFLIDSRVIRTQQKCYSKKNAANYLVERGYFVFGLEIDVLEFGDLNQTNITNHYLNYCIPVVNHMSDIITLNYKIKNEIIDVVSSGTIDRNKLNNHNIKYTNIKSNINPRKIMNEISRKVENKDNSKRILLTRARKSYWRVVNDD